MQRPMSKQEFERYQRRAAVWEWIIRLGLIGILVALTVTAQP